MGFYCFDVDACWCLVGTIGWVCTGILCDFVTLCRSLVRPGVVCFVILNVLDVMIEGWCLWYVVVCLWFVLGFAWVVLVRLALRFALVVCYVLLVWVCSGVWVCLESALVFVCGLLSFGVLAFVCLQCVTF